MTKLLEYKPDAKDTSNLSTLLAVDVAYGHTPDLPRLRFGGPQYVFIWDDLKNGPKMSTKLGLRLDVDWCVTNYSMYTQQSFRPFENWTPQNGEPTFFCPHQADWTESVASEHVEALKGYDAYPIQGRIIKCNLKTMIALDNYYMNGEFFQRVLTPVVSIGNNPTPQYVWMYRNSLQDIGKFDPHSMVYRLYGGLEPRLVRRVASAGATAYEVDAYRGTAVEAVG